MNKILIILLLIVCNLSALSQVNPNDTLCFKVSTIQNLLIDAKQKKLSDSLVTVLRQNISAYEIIVRELESKDSVNKEIIAVYKNQIAAMEKELKKWKRKVRWTAIAGAVAVGATVFILK
jgi:hypothetical protein